MPIIEYAPGARLSYRDTGSIGTPASTVVLLHGLGVNGRMWSPQIPVLVQAGRRVLSVDLPGFGGSSPWPGPNDTSHTVRCLSDPVARLVEALDLPTVSLVGLSMGGTVSLQLALDHPQRVERLLLVNTFARLSGGASSGSVSCLRLWPFYLYRFLLVQTVGLGRQAQTVAMRLFPRQEEMPQRVSFVAQVLQADPAAYRAAMLLLARFNVEPRLGEIDTRAIPTLVVTGEKDSIVAPETQRRMAQRIIGARHVVIPNANHAVTAERPEEFNQIMVDFLTGPRDQDL